ncbi:MAG: hypothetical protein M3Q07_15020 [Pseudobdellovibrionaceae bacterium]|nr:hypothetical protein [Pseudobdellovibrionaceae bacterium]
MKSLSLFKSLRSLVLISMAVSTLNSVQASDEDPIALSDDPFGLGTSIYAEPDAITSIVAPRYYSDTYPDLKAAYGYSNFNLYNHWLLSGRFEFRRPSPAFDPAFYLNFHSDLKAAFGNDSAKAAEHWYTNGLRECRQGSAEYNPRNYINRYPEVRAQVGDDCSRAHRHFIRIGYLQGLDAR